MGKKILVLCTTDSMIWNFLVPHINDLETKGYSVECACSETGDFFANLEKIHNLKMHKIEFARSPYNIKNYSAYKNLVKLVRKNQYDVIFCHEPVGGLMGRIVGKKCGCKVLYMAHGFHFFKGAPLVNKLVYYSVEKVLSKLTDVLITINEEDFEASQKFYAKKKYKINGIGIDTNKFIRIDGCTDLQKELNLNDDDYLLLSVGELIERKNHACVIEAIKRLDNPHIRYAIAGDGELYDQLSKMIEENGLTNQVYLLGYRTDISKLCNCADVFVMPSLQEGLSVALMEAMACAKPIIASKIRGNVDLIDDNLGGILVEAKDVSGYADAILYGYKYKTEFLKFGQYNSEKIKEFDVETVKKQLALIYSECLEETK